MYKPQVPEISLTYLTNNLSDQTEYIGKCVLEKYKSETNQHSTLQDIFMNLCFIGQFHYCFVITKILNSQFYLRHARVLLVTCYCYSVYLPG